MAQLRQLALHGAELRAHVLDLGAHVRAVALQQCRGLLQDALELLHPRGLHLENVYRESLYLFFNFGYNVIG